jgi:hypothetical protein
VQTIEEVRRELARPSHEPDPELKTVDALIEPSKELKPYKPTYVRLILLAC